jgi:hypothetical protein
MEGEKRNRRDMHATRQDTATLDMVIEAPEEPPLPIPIDATESNIGLMGIFVVNSARIPSSNIVALSCARSPVLPVLHHLT